jgi:transcriptional regulator with XRE-family HTH domain
MDIGDRLKAFRDFKNLSRGDIAHRTGLPRCYISRVENGHTVPSVETLERFARALDIPIYQIFHEDEQPPKETKKDEEWGGSGQDAKLLNRWCRLLSRTKTADYKLLLWLAKEMAKRAKPPRDPERFRKNTNRKKYESKTNTPPLSASTDSEPFGLGRR